MWACITRLVFPITSRDVNETVMLSRDPAAVDLSLKDSAQLPSRARKEAEKGIQALELSQFRRGAQASRSRQSSVSLEFPSINLLLGYLALQQKEQEHELGYLTTATKLDPPMWQICALLSASSVALAALLLLHVVPLSAGASLVGGGLEQLGPVAFFIYGAILGVLGLALWRRWKGARRAAIGLAAAGIFLAMPAISSAFGDERLYAVLREAIQIMVRVLVIYYLSQEPVKEWFAES